MSQIALRISEKDEMASCENDACGVGPMFAQYAFPTTVAWAIELGAQYELGDVEASSPVKNLATGIDRWRTAAKICDQIEAGQRGADSPM